MPSVSLTNAFDVTNLDVDVSLTLSGFSDTCDGTYSKTADKTWKLGSTREIVYVNDTFITDELIMTEEFLTKFNIDFVVHGFTPEDRIKQSVFFEIPIKLGKFIELDYHQGISTTNLINRTVTTLDKSVRHEDIYNLLQERINIENSSIVGEFGYEDDLLSKINHNIPYKKIRKESE